MRPEATFLLTGCLIGVGLIGTPIPIGAARQAPATVPLTTNAGFTVDVPADWQVTAATPASNARAFKPNSATGNVEVIDSPMGEVPTVIKSERARLTTIAHKNGTLYYEKLTSGPISLYHIFVVFGQRDATIRCYEAAGAPTSVCLTIAQSGRFGPPPSRVPSPTPAPPAPPASVSRTPEPAPRPAPAVRGPAAAPRVISTPTGLTIRMADGFTVTLPTGWQIVGSSARIDIEARSTDGFGRFRFGGGGKSDVTLQRLLPGIASSPDYVQMPLPGGRAYYQPGLDRRYRMFVSLHDAVWMFDCTDPPAAIGTCLAVLKGVRVDAPAPPTAAKPGSDEAPRGGAPPDRSPGASAAAAAQAAPATPRAARASVSAPRSPTPQAVAPSTLDAPDASAVMAELSKDARLNSVSAYNRDRALKEAEGSYGYCLSNVTLKNTLDCACYTKAFFTERLAAGFDVPSGTLLSSIVSGKISVKACVVPQKIQHYASDIAGRVFFATVRASDAQKQRFRSCVQRVAVERFMRNPVPEIQLLDAAAANALVDCQPELRP